MMRKMVGADDEVKYAVPPGFPRPGGVGGVGGGVGGGGALAHHPNLPPNMIPDAIMYNKFQQQQQQSQQQQHPSYFHNGEPSSSHLHKMEGLLKPCFDDPSHHHPHPHHHPQHQQPPYGNYAGNFNNHSHAPPSHHFAANTNLMESPFVNSFNGGGGSKGGELLNGPGVQIKQENDTFGANGKSNNEVLMYGRGSNSSSNPISGSSNVSSKAEPNEFNLNYSNSAGKGDGHGDEDSGIDKLTRLNENDSNQ